ncbi:MAG: amidase [Frankiales bacterium]|nr:MAG: amidase [Frankiales bacterium]
MPWRRPRFIVRRDQGSRRPSWEPTSRLRQTAVVLADPAAPAAAELARAVRDGSRSPVELVGHALRRLDEVDREISAFVGVAADRALAEAEVLAAEAADGRLRGPLHGVPVAVKDLYDVAGEVTRAGSRVPPTGRPAVADAAAVARLRAAGAVVIGRTRTHEYAWGMTTQHETLGGTRNPHDTSRTPGGSSGGSAAAVAAGVVPLALGSDTAASIRLPAAWCGLVGHKPTHGAVDLTGCVPLAPSLDVGGALVRTVEDARLAQLVLSGVDLRRTRDSLSGLRVGLPRDPTAPAPDRGIAAVLDRALADVDAVELPAPPWEVQRRVLLATQGAEAVAYHRSLGHWPDRAADYGSDVRSRLAAAAALTADDLESGARDRADVLRQVAGMLDAVDVLLLPVAGSGPSRVDDPDTVTVDGRAVPLRDQVLPHTLLANLCGLPACSVPVGLDPDGLPVGLQVVGAPGADALVLDVAELLMQSPS